MNYFLQILYLFARYCYMTYTKDRFTTCTMNTISLKNIGENMSHKGFMLANVEPGKDAIPKKKVVLFLSGLLTCAYELYIQKTIHDILEKCPNAETEYAFLVYENKERTSLEVATHIIAFIENYDTTVCRIEELNIFGFSAGGVLASHVMANIKGLLPGCKRRVITYDTPMSIIHIMRRFSNNMVYRFDYLYYYFIMLTTYRNHVDNLRIRDIVRGNDSVPVYRGVEATLDQLKRIHGFSNEELETKTQFTYVQPVGTEIYHLYCENDVIIDRLYNIKFRMDHAHKLSAGNPAITIIEKPGFDHCTDMWRNSDYVQDILRIMGME